MDEVSIYALSDPLKPQEIKYIGKTDQPLHRRLCAHVGERGRKNRRGKRIKWVAQLFSEGRTPLIWLIENCPKGRWEERERFWIWFFKPLGTLVNSTNGGEGRSSGWKWSKESRRRVSISRKGQPRTPAQLIASRANIEIARRTAYTPEARKKGGIARRGRKMPEEQRQKLSKALMGRKCNFSPEVIEMLRISAKKNLKWPIGKPRPIKSPETRAKLSLALKGKLRLHVIMPTGKPVLCVETGERFNSLWRASQSNGVACNQIRRAIRNNWTAGGNHWKLL